jgi:translation initiation factor eIF-2B subunit epsilon
LCNVPLLEWTLESLAVAGVQEVIVFCTTQAEMVQAALQYVILLTSSPTKATELT